MIDLTRIPLVLAQAQAAPGLLGGMLVPALLMVAIFYFIVLRPARNNQKKVAEFLSALKVGDKVITTGGVYGEITKIDEQTVQLQIAERVRILMARASVGGYQGAEPVVQKDRPGGI